MTNRYRESSKMFAVFNFLHEGGSHTLVDITNHVYPPQFEAGIRPLFRRRVASAIRTIRKNGVPIDFDGTEYHMTA